MIFFSVSKFSNYNFFLKISDPSYKIKICENCNYFLFNFQRFINQSRKVNCLFDELKKHIGSQSLDIHLLIQLRENFNLDSVKDEPFVHEKPLEIKDEPDTEEFECTYFKTSIWKIIIYRFIAQNNQIIEPINEDEKRKSPGITFVKKKVRKLKKTPVKNKSNNLTSEKVLLWVVLNFQSSPGVYIYL